MSNQDNDPDSLSAHPTDASFDDLLEHDYHDLLRRIAADGAAWRRALPPTDALARHTHSLGVHPLPGGAPAQRREDTRMEPTGDPFAAPSGRPAAPPVQREASRFHRSRQLVAGLAALVVVALFISVFASQSHRRGVGGTSTATTAITAKTPTPLPAGARLAAVPSLANLSGMPVFSSFDPNTVYVVNGTHITRSDDAGATWATLPNPANFPAGLTVSWIDLFVSPLNNKTVYATADLSNPNNSHVNNCPSPLPLGHIGAKVSLSGVVPCEATEISTDGGATWSSLRLANNLELGSASLAASELGLYDTYSASPVTQGHWIYTLAGYGPLASVGPDRLLNSGDGGVTWGFSDTSLVARGQAPCQFAATSTGNTLFAVTVPATSFCDPAYNAPVQFWRSDDGGASWR
ncbi:MAG: WD40/YVTN/BNR-like repeat-containing protein, partial [Ktedonobacterales bacterium]